MVHLATTTPSTRRTEPSKKLQLYATVILERFPKFVNHWEDQNDRSINKLSRNFDPRGSKRAPLSLKPIAKADVAVGVTLAGALSDPEISANGQVIG